MKRTIELKRTGAYSWQVDPHGGMRVPGVMYSQETLIDGVDDAVVRQVCNVASLPGIVKASYAMPDAHWGYGFPIGGVAAFDAEAGGVVSCGGVGFDISCGVRTLRTGLTVDDVMPVREKLSEQLFRRVPSGVGSTGRIHLDGVEMDEMLAGGAQWAVEKGYGLPDDLERVEFGGRAEAAEPKQVSARAKTRQQDEMGTLGSGNHYLEVQRVAEIYDPETASAFGLGVDDILVSIHCGSRALGHQIATEYARTMVSAAGRHGIALPERQLACAPIHSEMGQAYLGAMYAALNGALANRQILTHLARQGFERVCRGSALNVLYDVSHNTCKEERHTVDGGERTLYVHRKGATSARPPGHPELPEAYREVGQPVLIGGTMGTASYILVGTRESESLAFGSSVHGAGRCMSRTAARKAYRGNEVKRELGGRGILVKSADMRGVAEEAPGAYKDVNRVVEAAHEAGLSRRVAKVVPLIVVKG